MKNYFKAAIILSFFGLWLTSFLSIENQIFTGFSLILTFGILHGGNDIMIAKNILLQKRDYSFAKILTFYILIIVFSALLFYLFPFLILFLFILVSGYHFGEQQLRFLNKDKNKIIIESIQLLHGLLILFFLFEFHCKQVRDIIFDITSVEITPNYITYSLYGMLTFFSIGCIYLYLNFKHLIRILFKELFFLLVFVIIFKVSSLIWGFTIYFILWHSLPSIIDQITFLFGDYSKVNFIKYIKAAALYWIVSLIGLGAFYFFLNEIKHFNALFFVFLAAITFPHVLVIILMQNKIKKTE
jgi:Brp/Blh family beta-carotene 15,15'-monooxygenase